MILIPHSNSLNEVLPQIVVALKNGALQIPNRNIEIICPYCKVVFSDVHALECHNKQAHFTNVAYSCKFCSTYIMHKISLRKHLEICAGAKEAKCDPAKAESYFDVVERKKKQLKPNPNAKKLAERTYHCIITDHCAKFFESEGKLKEHIRKCHATKLIKCLNPACDELFSRKDNIYRHVRSQKGHEDFIHLLPSNLVK